MILGTRKTLGVCAVSAAAMAVAGPAYAASGDTVHESTKVNQEMTIKPDARGSGTSVGGVRARATRVSRSGRVLASKALATASTAAPARLCQLRAALLARQDGRLRVSVRLPPLQAEQCAQAP